MHQWLHGLVAGNMLANDYGLNVCAPSNSSAEVLMPKMAAIGGRVFGSCVGHKDGVFMTGLVFL